MICMCKHAHSIKHTHLAYKHVHKHTTHSQTYEYTDTYTNTPFYTSRDEAKKQRKEIDRVKEKNDCYDQGLGSCGHLISEV